MDVGPDLARLIERLRGSVEDKSPAAQLQAVATRARFMLRRLGDPECEIDEVLAALTWIVEVAERGKAPP